MEQGNRRVTSSKHRTSGTEASPRSPQDLVKDLIGTMALTPQDRRLVEHICARWVRVKDILETAAGPGAHRRVARQGWPHHPPATRSGLGRTAAGRRKAGPDPRPGILVERAGARGAVGISGTARDSESPARRSAAARQPFGQRGQDYFRAIAGWHPSPARVEKAHRRGAGRTGCAAARRVKISKRHAKERRAASGAPGQLVLDAHKRPEPVRISARGLRPAYVAGCARQPAFAAVSGRWRSGSL